MPYEEENWRQFFGGVADAIVAQIAPKTVLDAGCAKGFLVAALRERGVDASGFDLSEVAVAEAPEAVRDHVRVGSLTEPIEGRVRPDHLHRGHRAPRSRRCRRRGRQPGRRHRPGAAVVDPGRPRRADPRQHPAPRALVAALRRARHVPRLPSRPGLPVPVGDAVPAVRAVPRRGGARVRPGLVRAARRDARSAARPARHAGQARAPHRSGRRRGRPQAHRRGGRPAQGGVAPARRRHRARRRAGHGAGPRRPSSRPRSSATGRWRTA